MKCPKNWLDFWNLKTFFFEEVVNCRSRNVYVFCLGGRWFGVNKRFDVCFASKDMHWRHNFFLAEWPKTMIHPSYEVPTSLGTGLFILLISQKPTRKLWRKLQGMQDSRGMCGDIAVMAISQRSHFFLGTGSRHWSTPPEQVTAGT